MDGKENTENINEETSPKRNAKRTVKDKVIKYGSDDNEENVDDNESDYVGSDSETDKKIKSKSKPQVNGIFSCFAENSNINVLV